MKENKAEYMLVSWFGFFFAVGFVWISAWIFNPPITSNVVWFISVLFASIESSLSRILYRIS